MAVLKGTIQIDSSPAVAALQATAGAGDKAAKEITAAFQKALTAKVSTAESAKAFDGIRKAAQDSVNEQKSALAALIATGQSGSKAFNDTKAQLLEAAKEARRLDDALEAVNKEVDSVNNKPITIGDQLKQGLAGGISGGIVGGLIGGGVAGAVTSAVGLLSEGFTKVIELGSSFETGMQSLSAVTGATGPLLDDLGSRARNLATQFGGSANDQLTVFQTTLSKIGPQLAESPEALGKFAENVNILGKTDAALGAAGAVDALTGAMLQFGVDVNNSNEVARESTRFINVLAASAAVGSASVGQVAEAVAVVGATAKNANVSFEETNAALQVLASKSLVGSQAGTGLTTVLNKLQAQSKDGDDALKALGTSSAELGQLLNTGGIGPAIDKLRTAMDNLGTQAEKNALLNKLFGEGGQNAAAALLGSKEMLAQFTAGVTNTNSAVDQAAVNMATFSEFMSRLRARAEDFGIGLFQGIQSFFGFIIARVGPVLSNLSESIGGAFERAWSIIQPILAVVGASIITNLVATFTYAATVVSTVFDVFNRFFDGIKNAIQPVISAFGDLFGTVGEGFDPIKAFGDLLDIMVTVMTEVGAVVAELGGFLIELLLTPLRFIAEVIGSVVRFFGSFVKESKEVGATTEKNVPILERITGVFNNIKGTIGGLTASFAELKNIVVDFFGALTSLDFDKLNATFQNIGARLGKAYDEGFNKATGKTVGEQVAEDAADAADGVVRASDTVSAAAAKTAKAAESILKVKTDLFAKEQQQLKNSQLELENEIRRGALAEGRKVNEEEQRRILQGQADTAALIAAKYREIFGVASGEIATKLNFKTIEGEDPAKVLLDINTQIESLDKAEIDARINLLTTFDATNAVRDVKANMSEIKDALKSNIEQLTDGAIDTDAFNAVSTGLVSSVQKNIDNLATILSTEKLDEKQRTSIEGSIKELETFRAELEKQSSDAIIKADEARIKQQVDLNRRRIELLKADEEGNRDAIRALLEENLALETNIKLAGLKSTGDIRAAETAIILREAEAQASGIEEKYGELPGFLEKVAGKIGDKLTAAFQGPSDEENAKRDEAIKKIEEEEKALTQSMKKGETDIQSFQSSMDELRKKRDELGGGESLAERLLGATQKTAFDLALEKFSEFKNRAAKELSDLAKSGEVSFEALGAAVGFTFGEQLVQSLAAGQVTFASLLTNLGGAVLDALSMLAPAISAQYLAFLGPFALPAALVAIAGLRAALSSATSSIGAEEGVGVITKSYSGRRGPNDNINLWVAEGEGIANRAANMRHPGLIDLINKGGDATTWALQHASREDLMRALKLDTLGVTFTGVEAPLAGITAEIRGNTVVIDLSPVTSELAAMRKEVRSLRREIAQRPPSDIHVYPNNTKEPQTISISSRGF